MFFSKVLFLILHSNNLQGTFHEIIENEFSTSNIFLPKLLFIPIFYSDFFLQHLLGNLTSYFQVFTVFAHPFFFFSLSVFSFLLNETFSFHPHEFVMASCR